VFATVSKGKQALSLLIFFQKLSGVPVWNFRRHSWESDKQQWEKRNTL